MAGKSIRWVRHQLRRAKTGPLQILASHRAPGREAAAVAEPALAESVDLPDLNEYSTPIKKAEFLLQVAAEIEHALLVQYLYAAYSLQSANGIIKGIAIEEMSHLMTVQNLLLLIGSQPHFARQDFGQPSDDEGKLFPFELLLEPLSKSSLRKYVIAESPEQADTGAGSNHSVNRVGMLYTLLGVIFGTEDLLRQKVAEGDAWYQIVNDLAEEAALFYGGRNEIHLPEAAFDPTSERMQGLDSIWDRHVKSPHYDEFRIHVVKNREDALQALRDIGLQGEGPSLIDSEKSHFDRFSQLFKELFGADGSGDDPVSVHPVPQGAKILIGISDDPNAITHPTAMKWAQLGDLRYALLLGFLEQYFLSKADDREFLAAWSFVEMYNLKKISEYLIELPRSASNPTAGVAALPFNMPFDTGLDLPVGLEESRWPDIHAERLQAAINVTNDILSFPGPSEDEMGQFLEYMLESDRRKLEEAKARQNLQTTRTRFDRVRETLDWAVGTGDPNHSGSSPARHSPHQRRFWNLPLEHFKEVEIYGQPILEPQDEQSDSDPYLVQVLKTGYMPQNRPALNPDDERIAFIRKWIKDDCPDDPIQGGRHMSSFQDVLGILDQSVGGPDNPVGAHGPFWRGQTRDQFVNANIFGQRLIEIGNGAESNLVKALKGEAPFGSDQGTAGAAFRRMPAGKDPVPDEEIAIIQGWIDDGCPE